MFMVICASLKPHNLRFVIVRHEWNVDHENLERSQPDSRKKSHHVRVVNLF